MLWAVPGTLGHWLCVCVLLVHVIPAMRVVGSDCGVGFRLFVLSILRCLPVPCLLPAFAYIAGGCLLRKTSELRTYHTLELVTLDLEEQCQS